MKKILRIITLILLAGCINQNAEINQVCFQTPENPCVDIEIANTAEKRQKGLMNRQELGENKGMLFIFPEQKKHAFWMKNTTIPLDIIWISANLSIVDIKKNAQPCQEKCQIHYPQKDAIFALEVNANYTRKHNISKGTKITLQETQNGT